MLQNVKKPFGPVTRLGNKTRSQPHKITTNRYRSQNFEQIYETAPIKAR